MRFYFNSKDAIDADSFYEDVPPLKHGNVELGFSRSENILEGEIYVGGQDHFYLETQSVIAVPKNEDSEIEMFVSTQNPTQIQVNYYIHRSTWDCSVCSMEQVYCIHFLQRSISNLLTFVDWSAQYSQIVQFLFKKYKVHIPNRLINWTDFTSFQISILYREVTSSHHWYIWIWNDTGYTTCFLSSGICDRLSVNLKMVTNEFHL